MYVVMGLIQVQMGGVGEENVQGEGGLDQDAVQETWEKMGSNYCLISCCYCSSSKTRQGSIEFY